MLQRRWVYKALKRGSGVRKAYEARWLRRMPWLGGGKTPHSWRSRDNPPPHSASSHGGADPRRRRPFRKASPYSLWPWPVLAGLWGWGAGKVSAAAQGLRRPGARGPAPARTGGREGPSPQPDPICKECACRVHASEGWGFKARLDERASGQTGSGPDVAGVPKRGLPCSVLWAPQKVTCGPTQGPATPKLRSGWVPGGAPVPLSSPGSVQDKPNPFSLLLISRTVSAQV